MGKGIREKTTVIFVHVMDRRIFIGTKSDHNARREAEFLALSPADRFNWFLRSFDGREAADHPNDHKGNFIIRKRRDAVR